MHQNNEFFIKNNPQQISTEVLEAGQYFLYVVGEDGSFVQKLVKE